MKFALNLAHAKKTGSQRQSTSRRIKRLLLISTILWLCAVSIGLGILWNYENTPGTGANPPTQWPTDSRIQRETGRATLVMLVHPHCPCTRATISELAELMAHSQGRLTAFILFLKPAGFSDDWEQTDLWHSAASIPGVKVMVDDDGAEAHRFNSQTSGQTILYDADGHLMFSGGITSARGHAGDNDGLSTIISLVNEGKAERTETSVFGCTLFDANSECRK